jgi:hypothetical protein
LLAIAVLGLSVRGQGGGVTLLTLWCSKPGLRAEMFHKSLPGL